MIWSQILVVLLSVILGLFLVAGIVLVIMVIKVTVEIKSVSHDTKRAIGNIEQSVNEFTKTAKIATALSGLYKTLKRQSSKKKKRSTHDK